MSSQYIYCTYTAQGLWNICTWGFFNAKERNHIYLETITYHNIASVTPEQQLFHTWTHHSLIPAPWRSRNHHTTSKKENLLLEQAENPLLMFLPWGKGKKGNVLKSVLPEPQLTWVEPLSGATLMVKESLQSFMHWTLGHINTEIKLLSTESDHGSI